MKQSMFYSFKTLGLAVTAGLAFSAVAHNDVTDDKPTHLIEVEAHNSAERSAIANLGFAPEEFRSDKVYIYGRAQDEATLRKAGFNTHSYEIQPQWLKWREGESDKAGGTSSYHSYDQVNTILNDVVAKHPNIASLTTIGKSLENRDVKMVRLSGKSLGDAETNKLPVVFYMGCHHAREHLSVEMAVNFLQYLADNYGKNADVTRLVDTREIYIAPIVNPDGHVYDFKGDGAGNMWRKNRRRNANGTFGVDLNRNYGYGWGTGGSSTDPQSDVYMGPQPFSEIETQNVRDFVRSQPRMTTLLTLHTFSELVLYPWGHTNDAIGAKEGKKEDLPVFQKMAKDMAGWNHYTPEQASDLYIASGDTTDWAYGERGIFAFTFELTPTSMWDGGFYPEPTVIQPTFDANLKPFMYLLEFADNPHRVLTDKVPSFLMTPARSGIATASANDLSY